MRFVVPIPLSLYLIFVLIAFSIGMYAFIIVVTLGFIYFLFKEPIKTISLILIILAFKYWQIALPLLAVAVVLNYFFGDKAEQEQNSELLQIDTNISGDPQQKADKPNT